jgi:large subunit ribosomal protein L17
MLANMATSLIMHKRIETTLAKAKVLRSYVEPLLTKSKEDTTHSRRIVFSYLQSKEAVTELFRTVSAKIAERPGGYTRILKLGMRPGDSAEMCMIELVDFNENLLGVKEAKAKATRRGRRGGKKKEGEEVAETVAAAKAPKAKAKKEAKEEKREEPKEEVKQEPEASNETAEETPEAEESKE